MTVYVSVISYGYGDSHGAMVVYAGIDYKAATTALEIACFPEPENNFGCVEHWHNGKKVSIEEMID